MPRKRSPLLWSSLKQPLSPSSLCKLSIDENEAKDRIFMCVTFHCRDIDGKPYEAYVKPKDEAKNIYNQAQSQGQSAGLVELK